MTRTAISPRLAMRTLVSTPYGYLRAGRTCQISPGGRTGRTLRRRALGRPDGLHQRRRHGAGATGRARGHRPRRRPPDRRARSSGPHVDGAARSWPAAVDPAPTSRPGRRPGDDGRGRVGGGRGVHGRGHLAAPEVAERPRVARRRLRPDRKLAGILAEADWPAAASVSAGWKAPAAHDRAVVVVGIGINVTWPDDLPDELADIAVALNHIVSTAGRSRGSADRAALGARPALRRSRQRRAGRVAEPSGERHQPRSVAWSASISARDDVEGKAVDVTEEGHLVVDTLDGSRRVFAVGDVVHLR